MSVSRDPIGAYHDHLALLHDQLRIAQIAMYRQNRKVIIALEGYECAQRYKSYYLTLMNKHDETTRNDPTRPVQWRSLTTRT